MSLEAWEEDQNPRQAVARAVEAEIQTENPQKEWTITQTSYLDMRANNGMQQTVNPVLCTSQQGSEWASVLTRFF
jgi:hypothetical protein